MLMDNLKKGLNRPDLDQFRLNRNQKNITASLGKEIPLGFNGTTDFSVSQAPIYKGGKNGH